MPHTPLQIALSEPSEGRTIIVGGGAIGLAIAWKLACAGHRALVIERDTPGSGASGAAAGMLAPLAEIDYVEADALTTLKRESLRRFPAFCQDLEAASGLHLDYRASGTLAVAIDRDDAEALRHHFEHRRRLGLPVSWLTGDQARHLEPWLSPYIQAAIDNASDHQIDNRRLVEALHIAAQRAGARVLTHTAVLSVERDAQRALGVRVAEPDGDPVMLGGDTVTIAAGCWSRGIGGLDGDLSPPVRPVKGQMLSLRMPDEPVLSRVVRAPDCYLVPRSDGRLIVGATSEEKGFDTSLTAGGLFELLRGAYETLPVVYELPLVRQWAGLRPGSLDNDPILGHTRLDGLIMATGHYRNGILLTPITADTICEAILTRQDPDIIAPFGLARFA